MRCVHSIRSNQVAAQRFDTDTKGSEAASWRDEPSPLHCPPEFRQFADAAETLVFPAFWALQPRMRRNKERSSRTLKIARPEIEARNEFEYELCGRSLFSRL